jgi:hypothetical protein
VLAVNTTIAVPAMIDIATDLHATTTTTTTVNTAYHHLFLPTPTTSNHHQQPPMPIPLHQQAAEQTVNHVAARVPHHMCIWTSTTVDSC